MADERLLPANKVIICGINYSISLFSGFIQIVLHVLASSSSKLENSIWYLLQGILEVLSLSGLSFSCQQKIGSCLDFSNLCLIFSWIGWICLIYIWGFLEFCLDFFLLNIWYFVWIFFDVYLIFLRFVWIFLMYI